MTNYGLISIILTLYNKAPYIEETIFSIYKQSNQNRELIIVDDCSTDGSYEIAKSFCKKLGIEKKCKFIQNEKNLRVAKTFERGLKESKGDWISMCDGDDILVKNHLEEKIKYCNENNMRFCCGGCIDIDENNNFLGIWGKGLLGWIQAKYLRNRTYKKTLILPNAIGTAIFFDKSTKETLLNYGFPENIFQDFWTEVCASILNIKIGYINKTLFYHRRCDNCLSVYKKGILQSYTDYFNQRVNIASYIVQNFDINNKKKVRINNRNLINIEFLNFIKGKNKFSTKLFSLIIKKNIGLENKLILLFQYINTTVHKFK